MVCRMNTHPLPGCYEHVFDSPLGHRVGSNPRRHIRGWRISGRGWFGCLGAAAHLRERAEVVPARHLRAEVLQCERELDALDQVVRWRVQLVDEAADVSELLVVWRP